MKRALFLAGKGKGTVNPNPLVGAVVVNHGHIVGQAYHRKPGEPHAEILALHRAGPKARGGVLYVTLEPCVHTRKRTPPCLPLLLQAGLKRVCIAMIDPNPQVCGRGVQALMRGGIAVATGLCESDAQRLNEVYVHWMTWGRPMVTLKSAMTLDGKIATSTGQSRWVTGTASRKDVQKVRTLVDAILVGVGTVLRDNPSLSARGGQLESSKRVGRQPVRVILDSRLRTPLSSNVCRWTVEQPTIFCTTSRAPQNTIQEFQRRGVEVWVLPRASGGVSLRACLRKLGQKGLLSVLIEGGSTVNATAVREKVVDYVRLYLSPKFLGGQDAKSLIGGPSPKSLNRVQLLEDVNVRRLGQDFLFTGTFLRAP